VGVSKIFSDCFILLTFVFWRVREQLIPSPHTCHTSEHTVWPTLTVPQSVVRCSILKQFE